MPFHVRDAVAYELFSDVILCAYGGGGEPLDVEFAFLAGIQVIELGFHEFHIFLLGDVALFIRFHEREKLFDLILAHDDLVLRLGDGLPLCGSGDYRGKHQENRGDQNSCDSVSSGRHDVTPLAGWSWQENIHIRSGERFRKKRM
jgi:hypothetical protein